MRGRANLAAQVNTQRRCPRGALPVRRDEIGPWSEEKLEILRKYVQAYRTIMRAQPGFTAVYIDAFAGPGIARSATTGDDVSGSPLQALSVSPPFDEYHFVDMDEEKIDELRARVADLPNVRIYNADCNQVLCDRILPSVRWKDRRRAFCLLDPYGLHLRWDVFQMAGAMGTIDILVNFSVMDVNMNVALRDPSKATPAQIERMNRFWGDESWRDAVYTTAPLQPNLFGEAEKMPNANETIAHAFCERLRTAAGFAHVAPPLAMRNSIGKVLYYLVFASPKETGARIARDIFQGYRH